MTVGSYTCKGFFACYSPAHVYILATVINTHINLVYGITDICSDICFTLRQVAAEVLKFQAIKFYLNCSVEMLVSEMLESET